MYSVFLVLAACANVALAHFRLLYPEPRGAFVADQEPNYCGGYTQVTSNRSTFPVSGGFFSINTGHPGFIVGVLLSTVQNPISFDNFSSNGEQQLARGFAAEEDAGTFCFPLYLNNTGIDGVEDGANVTIQIAFEGGDGPLYQCADLTLSNNVQSNTTCQNETESDDHSHSDDDSESSTDNNGAQALALNGLLGTLLITIAATLL